jgi:RNA-dependent RNA polymerase
VSLFLLQVSFLITVSIFLKVTRSPCKLPTDVQKVCFFILLAYITLTYFQVKAVFKPELDDYVNVIVFSIKGFRSLASMLGTGKRLLHTILMTCQHSLYNFSKGDYDGDMVICIWQPDIVEEFSNADPKFMDPPAHLNDYFNVENETVTEFLRRVPPSSPIDTQIRELQEVLMTPLSDVHSVGIYSTMHENAMYSLGYSHPTTVLLAWM